MIELVDVSKTYRAGDSDLKVLRNVNLRIAEGEFVSIMGPSGSGKSTLMHIMGCLDVPSTGQYRLRSKEIQTMSSEELAHIRNEQIGFVFQNFHLLPRMTALRNVELPLVYKGVRREARQNRAKSLLAKVGLSDRLHHLPNTLSGGQKQRVAIARALANEPAILLADEPTGALDSATGREIMSVFEKLNEQGVTVIVITHDANVASYARRIIELTDGQIVGERRPAVDELR